TLPPPPDSPLLPYTTLFRSLFLPSLQARTLRGPLGPERLGQLQCLFGIGELDVRLNRWRVEQRERHRFSCLEGEFGDTLHVLARSEEHTSELQSRENLVCRL